LRLRAGFGKDDLAGRDMAQHDDIDSLACILKDSISFTGQFTQVNANAHIRGRGDRGHDHRSKKNLGESY